MCWLLFEQWQMGKIWLVVPNGNTIYMRAIAGNISKIVRKTNNTHTHTREAQYAPANCMVRNVDTHYILWKNTATQSQQCSDVI